MRLFPGLQISQSALRLATAGVAVMLLAGCSSDSTRLAGVGIVPRHPVAAARADHFEAACAA